MRLAVAGKLVQVQPGIQVHAFHDDGLAIRQALHSTVGFRRWKEKALEAQCVHVNPPSICTALATRLLPGYVKRCCAGS